MAINYTSQKVYDPSTKTTTYVKPQVSSYTDTGTGKPAYTNPQQTLASQGFTVSQRPDGTTSYSHDMSDKPKPSSGGGYSVPTAVASTPTVQSINLNPADITAYQQAMSQLGNHQGNFSYGAYQYTGDTSGMDNAKQHMQNYQGEFAYDPYKANVDTTAYDNAKNQLQNYGAYNSRFDADLQNLYNQIQHGDKFKYDLNSDALYQQYRDQYVQQGQNAMRDAMGQASALTGGYGSSYGQAVGQQQYGSYLQSLNDIVPELYDRAYQQYNDEYNRKLNAYQTAFQADQNDYNRWSNDRDYWANMYNTEWQKIRDQEESDYNRWNNGYNQAWNQYLSDRDYWTNQYNDEYQKYREADDTAYNRWNNEYSQAWDQYNSDRDYWTGRYDTEYAKLADEASQRASMGDFGAWASLYGEESARQALASWAWQNEDLARKLGYIK